MTYAAEVLADSPYGYYKLDESVGATTAVDSSGNSRDMTHIAGSVAFGSASLISDGTSCGTFDTNDELGFSNTTVSTGGLTIEAWVKTTGTTQRGFIHWTNSGSVSTKRMTLEMLTSGLVQATVFLVSSGTPLTLTSTTAVNNGAPHHIVLTTSAFSGGSAVLYIDGTSEASGTAPAGTAVGVNRMRLGGIGASGTRWNGDVDEGAFYNSALTSGRVATHHSFGILAVTLSGSLPSLTGAFTLDAGPFATLSGSIGSLTGSFDVAVSAPPELTFAGDLPALTGAFSLEAPPTLTLAGDIGQLTGSFSVTVSQGVTLAGQLPALTGSFVISSPPGITFSGSIGEITGEFALSVTPQSATHNRLGGRIRRGIAVATWDPPVVEPPASIVHDYDVAIAHSDVTINGTQVDYDLTSQMVKRHRDRIVVGGKDVTFFRGVETPTPEYRLIQPLLYGAGTLELPQVQPVFEHLGTGALKWLRKGNKVKVQRVDVDTNEVVSTDYVGIITGFSVGGRGLVVNLGGLASGKAALIEVQPPVFKRYKDAGVILFDDLRQVVRDLTPWLGIETGIQLATFGGMSLLDHINEVCSKAGRISGQQLTVGRLANGTWSMWYKNRSTIHATAYFDDSRMQPQLDRDITEEPNRIYATGVTKEGRKVAFRIYPGLKQGEPAPYPFGDNRTFDEGTTDAETDGGDGITVMNNRLVTMGYLDREDNEDKVYDVKVTRAIRRLQDDAGLSETGDMNPATWRALYDLDATGYSLNGAKTLPAAQRSKVRAWNRTASGALSSRNPDFDPHVVKVDRTVDMGPGFERQQIRDWARDELGPEDNWVGTVQCHLALIRGEHTPGDPIDVADVMPAREVTPGMNVWAPFFDGGTLFHVVGVQVPAGGRAPILTLDTRARDTMEAWECIARNRESRNSPARAWLNQYRSSKVGKDGLGTWDSVGGRIDDRVRCNGGQWTVFPVVAGQEGTVRKIRIQTTDNQAEFACAVFGRRITEKRLNHMIDNPLTTEGTEKWEAESVRRRLDERVLLYASGTHDQPLGYAPGRKTGDDGEPTGKPITGLHEDDAEFSYHTFAEPVLWVAVWADRDCSVQAGRIMWQQLEEGS